MSAVDIKIVIPSMGRADRVLTKNAISNAVLCVPESEEAAYREHNPGMEIIVHPDSLKGLPLKRQFIYDHFPNSFQIDDDVKQIRRLYTEAGEEAVLDKDEAYDIVQYIGNCAKMAGCFLFGISKECNPLAYDEFHPVQLTGIINGDIGLLEGSKLFFHEMARTTDDYWISGYNAFINRYCWIDKRFVAVAPGTFTNTGGTANTRTSKIEMEDTLFLRQMFGDAIQLKEDTKLAKRKSEYQRTLKIPY